MEKVTENITRACLQLNDKIYPVHEGHNTVGRNPDAVINIKNLNVSKTHAVITVFDKDSHFLSDFKSANGTFLDSKQLSPLQLYKLNSGASVKFGDVVCTYKKLDDGKVFRKSLAESQAFGESFYGASTQAVDFPNLPEGINFNELPTQVFAPADLSINEMPTQMHDFADLDDSSNDSIDYMTMQKASETQMLGNKSDDDKVQPVLQDNTKRSEVDHVEDKVQPASNSKGLVDSDTDDDLSQGSVIRPIVQKSKKITDSHSSETDDDLTPSGVIKPVKKLGRNAIESDSDTDDDLQNNKSKYHISDDSETDVGENEGEKDYDLNESGIAELPKNSQENPVETFRLSAGGDKDESSGSASRMSKKILPQDHLYCQALSQTQDHLEQNEERFFLEKREGEPREENNDKNSTQIETVVEKPGKAFQTGSVEEESQREKDEERQSQKNKEEILEQNSHSPKVSGLASGKDSQETSSLPMLQHTEEQDKESQIGSVKEGSQREKAEERQSQNKEKIPEQNSHSPKVSGPTSCKDSQETSSLPMLQHSEEAHEDVGDLTTESINFNFLSEDIRPLDESSCRSPREADERRSQKKEKDCGRKDLSQKDEDLNQKETPEAEDKDENDDLDHWDEEKEETLQSGEPSHKDDDIYLQPTQTLNFFTETKTEEKQEKTPRKDDDVYFQPTQTLPFVKETKKNLPPVDDFFKDDDDEIFMQPTQVLVNSIGASPKLPSTKPSNENDGVFLHPAPAMENIRDQKPRLSLLEKHDDTRELDEDDFLPPTQAMERLHGYDKVDGTKKSSPEKNDDVDGFFPPTQALESLLSEDLHSTPPKDVFLQPNPSPLRKSTRRKIIPEKSPTRKEEDSFVFQPTQALEELHDDGTPFNKVEDQLHEIFASQTMLCTQQLVDVLDSSKDEVIEDSMLQDRNVTLTELTVKAILEDGEDLVVNRSLKKKEVKTYSKKKGDEQDEECEPSTSAGRGADNGDDGKGKKTKRKQDLRGSEKQEEVIKEESKSGEVKSKKKGKGKQENADKQVLVTDESKEGGKKKSKVKGNVDNQNEKEQGSKIAGSRESTSGATKRGRKKQIVLDGKKQKADDQNENDTEGSKGESQGSCSSESGQRKSRRRQNLPALEQTDSESSPTTAGTSSLEADGSERRGRGKWRQTLEAIEETKPSTSRRGKQQNVEKETPTTLKRTRATLEVLQENQQEPSKKLRKKDEPPETPTKKKAISPANKKAPKKRGIKLVSDSDDEIQLKVAKITEPPTRLRNARKNKKEDTPSGRSASTDQQTPASASSEPTGRTRRLSANSRRQKKEEETTRRTETPERSRRMLKPKVVFTMMDNPELESLIRQLGGSVVDSVDSCTVLVTGSVKRSQKLLCAVAQGKPVCSPLWLYACKKAFAFVDPWEHLLIDTEAEKKWNFSLRESISRASNAKLLQDYTFQIMVSKGTDAEKVLKGAIEACGGKCVTKNLAKSDSKYLMIVSNESQKTSYSRVVKQHPNIKVVQAEAIFDGTLRQKFKFNEFLLS